MNCWFTKIQEKPYLIIEFAFEEVELFKKHHEALTKLTNFDFNSIFDINKIGCPLGVQN